MAAEALSRTFVDPIVGTMALWKVFWIYGAVICLAGNLLFLLVSSEESSVRAARIAYLLVLAFWAASIWRCAFNCEMQRLGYFARAFATLVMGFVLIFGLVGIGRNVWAAI